MTSPFRIKICGVCTVDDAHMIHSAGADAIGLNFWPQSPRFVSTAIAKEISAASAGKLVCVGVFVNPTHAEVEQAFAGNLIDWAQFHGDESSAFCEQFAGRYIKAIRIATADDVKKIALYPCETVLVDAATSLYGGAGVAVEEDWATLATKMRSLILAGGLTPENVAAKIERVRPTAVDVASGVETRPREKSELKVRNFITAAKQAFERISP